MTRITLTLAVLVTLFVSAVDAEFVGIQIIEPIRVGPVGASAGGSLTIGWAFSPNNPITITELGWFDDNADGLTSSHPTAIWGTDGTLIGSVDIPAGTATRFESNFRYEATPPISLNANTEYIVAGLHYVGPFQDIVAQDSPPAHPLILSVNPLIDFRFGRFLNNSESQLGFPDNDVQQLLVGPNFIFDYTEPSIPCDFDISLVCDVVDIDMLVTEIVAGTDGERFDLTDDSVVNFEDLEKWLSIAAEENGFAGPYLLGDANLDGRVDSEDLNAIGIHWQQEVAAWSAGDFAANGTVDVIDLNELGINWQRVAVPGAAPVAAEGHGVPRAPLAVNVPVVDFAVDEFAREMDGYADLPETSVNARPVPRRLATQQRRTLRDCRILSDGELLHKQTDVGLRDEVLARLFA